MVTFAEQVKGTGTKREADLAWREGTVEARLAHALVHGVVDFIEAGRRGGARRSTAARSR